MKNINILNNLCNRSFVITTTKVIDENIDNKQKYKIKIKINKR